MSSMQNPMARLSEHSVFEIKKKRFRPNKGALNHYPINYLCLQDTSFAILGLQLDT